ncbi:unnamed protein product [Amoebophrya sp. A25]|nr:unnamed protein product [Amoebophrya sp. A25]|eukprot:GSA25T00023178001.1
MQIVQNQPQQPQVVAAPVMMVQPVQVMPIGAPGQPVMMQQVAPHQMHMPQLGDDYKTVLAGRSGLTLKQTMKGSCCDAKNEWTGHAFHPSSPGESGPEIFFIDESASCFERCCLSHFMPAYRPTSYDMWCGSWSGMLQKRPSQSEVVLRHKKECTCPTACWIAEGDGGPLRIPCCCFLPYLDTLTNDGTKLGRTQYECDMYLCVPKYSVRDGQGMIWYRIRPDTCCGGCCVLCECGGKKGRCLAVPFYIRHPKSMDKLPGDEPGSIAQINNLWSGIKECCNRQNYAVRFPQNASPEQKATLVGSVFLIDMVNFEQEQT